MELLVGQTSDARAEESEPMRLHHIAAATLISAVAGCSSIGHGARNGENAVHAPSAGVSYGTRVDRRYIRPEVKGGVLIMPFFDHNFSSACFDTVKCRVLYNGRYDTNEEKPTGPLTEAILHNLNGSWLLDSFPSVAQVSWVSKDGVSHEEAVDLGSIFRSKLVRYAEDLDITDVDLSVYYSTPDIILVVEDRSIHVYMKAMIALCHPVDPNNKFSSWREDLVDAYTHEF